MGEDVRQERSRLIDHFKRVYTIIAGLAITEAVRRLVPLPDNVVQSPSIWLFLTFFITIVPIFHGGDRSLDLKYLDAKPKDGRQRFKYLWDVYMLLVTAMLFVAIAEAIPKPSDCVASRIVQASDALPFFILMGGTFAFDVFILVADGLMSDKVLADKLLPYKTWIGLNAVSAIVCFAVAYALAHADRQGILVVQTRSVDLHWAFPAVAVGAFVRTVWDYRAGKDFLFP